MPVVSVTEMVWPYSLFRSPKWLSHRPRFGHRNGLALLVVSVTEMDSSITSVSVTEMSLPKLVVSVTERGAVLQVVPVTEMVWPYSLFRSPK